MANIVKMDEIKVMQNHDDSRTQELKPMQSPDEAAKMIKRNSGHKLTKTNNKNQLFLNDQLDIKGQKLCDIDGVLSLIVDKSCISDEEGMRELITMLQKFKSKIEGIVIQDFGGAFKVDYLKRIELTLREVKKLRLIVIHNSNLTREHIQILRNIIWWRREQLEKIYLNKNSIDSFDFNDLFVSSDFNFTDLKCLKMLEIKVQPGINKLTKNQFTEFANLISKNNIQITNSKKNNKEGLYISLDETSLNNKNKKLLRQSSDTLSSIHLEETNTQRLFYSLNLGGCFSDKNEAGIRYLGEHLIGENFDDITFLSFRNTTLKTQENWIPIFSFLKRTKTILNLDLSSCSLNDKSVSSLFSSAFNIKQINLSDNNNIQLNGWKKIFESLICNQNSITDHIRIDKCYFQDSEIVQLGNMILFFNDKINKAKYNCPLIKFYFNYNPSISIQGWQKLLGGIFKLASNSLETIELRGCDLNESKLKGIYTVFSEAYAKGGNLEEIVLRNNPRLGNSQSLCMIFDFAFKNLKNFKKFDISNCNLSDQVMIQILKSYSMSNLILEQLIIKNNPELGQESYKLLAQLMIFTEKSFVNKIDISGNQITKEKFEGFIQVGKQFMESGKSNPKLNKFILNQSKSLNDETFSELVDLVLFSSQSIKLQKVSLKNTLTSEKIATITRKLAQLEQMKQNLQLKHICLDKNAIPQANDFVNLLDAVLLKSQACPKLENISLSYCNLWNQHAKLLYQKFKSMQANPVNLKRLSLKGNVSATSDGWYILAHLLFQSGIFTSLEALDISYCKLEETSISLICQAFSKANSSKPSTYKHPLIELTINENPLLESDDWQNLFDSFIFSKTSQIKTLNASNSGFDTRSMQYYLEHMRKFKVELEKDGFFEDSDRHQLVNLNIQDNDQIDENTWKSFISVYILNKTNENSFNEQFKQQLQNEEADALHVQKEFSILEQKYKIKLNEYKVVGKLPLFQVKHLDLRGTSTLDGNQWKDLFSLLIINERSQIEFLGLSQTFIEHHGWENIINLINEHIQSFPDKKLKIKTIQFNDNSYLTQNQWISAFKKLFFNPQLLSLSTLELDNCKIDKEILKIFQYIVDPLELQVLKLKRNGGIDSLLELKSEYLLKIRTIECDQSLIPSSNIPTNLSDSLVEFTVKLSESDPLQQIKDYCNTLKKLEVLTVKGQLQKLDEQYNEIIELITSKLVKFSINNQNFSSKNIFHSIVQANTSGTKLQNIDLLGSNIDTVSAEEQKRKKKEDENNVLIHNQANPVEQKTEEEKKQEALKEYQERRKEWEGILSSGQLNNNSNKTIKNLTSINLSQTYSVSVTGEEMDCLATEYSLRYAALHCSNLQDLYISNCYLSEKAFQAFCTEYQKNPQISLKRLDLSNNQQLKTESWKFFFEKILFQKKTNLDFLDLSKNLIQKDEFELLRKLSLKFSSSNFGIKKLKLKNMQKNIESSLWIQCFFIDFIKIENRKVERIYLNNSLSLESQNSVCEFLKLYVQNSSCNIKQVYGYYEITQIFRDANPEKFAVLNLATELKANSEFAVIDMWKKALVNEKISNIKCQNQLSEEFVSGIPRMSLDLIQDFFQPMDQAFYKISNNKNVQINVSEIEKSIHILCFDYQSIKLISKYFNDGSEKNESINPQTVILNDKVVEYLQKPRIYKQIYFIQHRYFDVIDTQQVYQLFLKFKDSKIDSIIIDYDLRQVDLDPNLSERRLINLIRLFPPKSLELTNVSINALKAIYSIISSNDNFRYANVNFSSQSFVNNGIAFSLREQLYMGKKRKNFILKAFDYIAYGFLNLFCVEAQVYKFDVTIPILNQNLKTQRKYFNIMILLTMIYYAICIVCPYFLTKAFGVFVKTKQGVAWESHYVYLGFAVLSCIIEIIVYKFAYDQIKHLLPKIIDVESVDSEDKSVGNRMKQFFKKRIYLVEWITYIIELALSQFDRFDLYSDVCFIVICFKMEQYIIGFISLAIIANQLLTNILKLMIFIYTIFVRDSRRLLNTHEINSFCELSNLLEFEALNNILDTVAPYNISFIPNNFLFKWIMPHAAGQSISNRLLNSMQKFLLEDALQIILQLAYIISQQESDSTVIISIISSCISLFKAFYKFMSIRPTTISQLDFDYLSKIKRNKAQEYNNQLITYRNNMLSNIQQQVDKYVPNSIITIKNENKNPEKQPLLNQK